VPRRSQARIRTRRTETIRCLGALGSSHERHLHDDRRWLTVTVVHWVAPGGEWAALEGKERSWRDVGFPSTIAIMKLSMDNPKHEHGAGEPGIHEIEPEYVTTAEVAARLRLSPRSIRERIRTGIFQRGKHFFEPSGSARRWKWSAIVAWMEGKRVPGAMGERLRRWMQAGAALDVDRRRVDTTDDMGR